MKYILPFIAIFTSSLVDAQSTFLEYFQTMDSTNYKCELTIYDTISFWKEISPDPLRINEFNYTIKKKNENKQYFNEAIFLKTFYVFDSLCNFNWVLTNDTVTILNQKCLSATTSFRGRSYTAFYAPSLPMNDGPWKFCGLPGLVLKVKSIDGYLSVEATKISTNSNVKIDLLPYKKLKAISWAAYSKIFIKTMDNAALKVKSSMPKDDSNSVYKFKMSSTEIIYPKFQTGEGFVF